MTKRNAVLGLAAVLVFAVSASAIPVNMGFEGGNTGWTSTIPAGGAISVDPSHTSDLLYTYLPVEGDYFARLAPDGITTPVTLSQTFTVGAGYILGGFAAFDSRDYIFPTCGPNCFNDNAWVKIFQGTTLLATPWTASVASVGDFADGPWTMWTYTFAAGGTYTLEYGVINAGDSLNDSYAMFDAVPEPTTLLLLGAGLMGLGARARRRRV